MIFDDLAIRKWSGSAMLDPRIFDDWKEYLPNGRRFFNMSEVKEAFEWFCNHSNFNGSPQDFQFLEGELREAILAAKWCMKIAGCMWHDRVHTREILEMISSGAKSVVVDGQEHAFSRRGKQVVILRSWIVE